MLPDYPGQDFEIRSMTLPTTHTAIVQSAGGGLEVKSGLPLPVTAPHQVLVKVMAVALNPCDYKMHTRFPCPGSVNGCDFSGIVVQCGSDTAKTARFRLGDGVFGAAHGSNPSSPTTGSFAEYVAIDAEFTFMMPAQMSWEEAACIGGTGPGTLGLVLKEELCLPGSLEMPAVKPVDVLVWGGATSIGSLALQMLHRMGHRPITTCSPLNETLMRSNGATTVFDYHDAACGNRIREATRNSLRYAIDPFGSTETMSACHQAIGRAGGKYVALEVYPQALHTRRSVQAKFVNGLSILGYPIDLDDGYGVPASESRRTFGVEWFAQVQKWINEGGLHVHPMRRLDPGFEAILPGLEELRAQRVSAQKLIGRIAYDATEQRGLVPTKRQVEAKKTVKR